MSDNNWPLWEIFIRSKAGLHHKHAGSLRAADEKMAIENRNVSGYFRTRFFSKTLLFLLFHITNNIEPA